MLEPYRRDLIAKSFFRITEILVGAAIVSIWFSQTIPLINKFAVGIAIVLEAVS